MPEMLTIDMEPMDIALIVLLILNGLQFLFFGIRKLINYIGDHRFLSLMAKKKIDTLAITESKDMEEYNLQKEGSCQLTEREYKFIKKMMKKIRRRQGNDL